MADSQAELEHINLQRKRHSTMNYAVSQEMIALMNGIPELIDMKKGVVLDDIHRFDPDRKDPMTEKKLYRNRECIRTLEAVHKAIKEHREAVGEVDLSEDDKKPLAHY